MSDKPKPLKVQEVEVKPPVLPKNKRLVATPQEDPPREPEAETTEKTEEETTEKTEEPDTRPRAERRRSQREMQKAENEQKKAAAKYMQQMAKPIRFRDMGTVVNQVFMQLHPIFQKLQDDIDKLSYLPDYLKEKTGIEVSIPDFEEWFEEVKEKLEAEDTSSGEEGEPVEGQALAVEENEETREDVSPPETEETQ